jgi:hypothetical protein
MLKLTKHILTTAVLASVAVAQTSATKPASTTTAPTKQAATKAPAKTAPAPAKATTTTAKAPVQAATKTPAPKPATSKPAASKPAAAPAVAMKEAKPKAEKPAAGTVASKKYSSRRDPFLNPIKMRADNMAKTAACTTGARCLMIDQVVLKGVVKTQQGMIAMVENSAKKQYNLREKDPVYNGFVLKITGDSIVFKENATDNSGKATTREVVKRVTVPVV